MLRRLVQRGVVASYDPNSRHAHRRPRPLLPRPHAPRRLARAQRQPVGCRGEDRRDPPRGIGPRHLGADVAHLLPFAAGSGVRERRATRTPAAAPRSRPCLRHRQPQLHDPRLCRDRPLPRCRDGRDQARGQPPRDRPAARPDLRAGSEAGRAGAPPRVAAPAARLAGAGGVGRRRARRTGRAPSGCTLYSRSHRRWRGLAALARGTRTTANVYVDLSGSGVDGGMLEACLEAAGVERLLWGTDLTMDTGWAKLRYLVHLLSPAQLELVKWKNAARIFPRGAFPAD